MSKWPASRLKYVDVAIYKQRVWVTDSREMWARACLSLGDAENADVSRVAGSCMWWTNPETGHTTRLMGVFERSPGILAHECAHTAMDICTALNVGFDKNHQEAYCYLLEFLFENAARELHL